jgi:hypothetical protein
MQLRPKHTVVLKITRSALFVLISLAALTALASGKRIRLIPKLTAGAMLRYRIESTTTTSGNTTTPIVNPEGATRSLLTIHMLVRLDVLSAPADANPGPIHFRATYEKSEAESQSDAFDPGQPSISEQYAHLQGRSIDFTLDPSGKIADAKSLEQAAPDLSAAQSAHTLLNGLIPSSELPDGGIEIGQKWKSEKPMTGAPFSDLVWRSESTFLRDEPCPQAVASGTPGQDVTEAGACAVILTTFTISRRGTARADATPDDYARNGLRVAGTWTGSGQTLDSVSLATGLLVRSTQTMDQQADYDIISTANGSKVHQQSHVQSQSETVLEPAATVQQ